MMWLHCSEKFFLKKLSGYSFDEKQGNPAAMGSAFDAFVKTWIAHKIGLSNEPKLQVEELLKSVQIPDTDSRRAEILRAGKNLAKLYMELGLVDRLLKENVSDLELHIFEIFHGVRILGLPDGVITQSDGIKVPLDWKVRGYGSKHGYSPTQGYTTYISNDGTVKDWHSKRGDPLENLNDRWAIQMAIYFWLLNPGKMRPGNFIDAPCAIEEATYGRKNIVFTQIRTVVSAAFQETIWEKMKRCWTRCESPGPAEPNKMRCMAYNQLCDCAIRCEAFKSWQKKLESGSVWA